MIPIPLVSNISNQGPSALYWLLKRHKNCCWVFKKILLFIILLVGTPILMEKMFLPGYPDFLFDVLTAIPTKPQVLSLSKRFINNQNCRKHHSKQSNVFLCISMNLIVNCGLDLRWTISYIFNTSLIRSKVRRVEEVIRKKGYNVFLRFVCVKFTHIIRYVKKLYIELVDYNTSLHTQMFIKYNIQVAI